MNELIENIKNKLKEIHSDNLRSPNDYSSGGAFYLDYVLSKLEKIKCENCAGWIKDEDYDESPRLTGNCEYVECNCCYKSMIADNDYGCIYFREKTK